MNVSFTGEGVVVFVLLSMRKRYELELKGMKGSGPSMYSLVKKRYGFKGNRQSVYRQFSEYVDCKVEEVGDGVMELS